MGLCFIIPPRFVSPVPRVRFVFISLRGACVPRYCCAAPPCDGAIILPRQRRGEFFTLAHRVREVPCTQGVQCSRWRMPSVPVHRPGALFPEAQASFLLPLTCTSARPACRASRVVDSFCGLWARRSFSGGGGVRPELPTPASSASSWSARECRRSRSCLRSCHRG